MVSCIPRILSDVLYLRNELLDLSDIEINSLVFAGGYFCNAFMLVVRWMLRRNGALYAGFMMFININNYKAIIDSRLRSLCTAHDK